MSGWEITRSPWPVDEFTTADEAARWQKQYGDEAHLHFSADGSVSVCELLDAIGPRYLQAHLLTMVTGRHYPPQDFGLAGEVSAWAALIQRGNDAAADKARKRAATLNRRAAGGDA